MTDEIYFNPENGGEGIKIDLDNFYPETKEYALVVAQYKNFITKNYSVKIINYKDLSQVIFDAVKKFYDEN